jgi:hypothetical protein
MAGNKGMVIQERDLRLLRELGVMRVVDREQAAIVAGFASTTRVNARLLALTRSGLLRRFFLGTTAGGTKALYALSAKGAQLVGVPLRGPQRRKDESIAEIIAYLQKKEHLAASGAFQGIESKFKFLGTVLEATARMPAK